MFRVTYEGPPGGEEIVAARFRSVGLGVHDEPVPIHPDIIREEIRVTIEVLGNPPIGLVRRVILGLVNRYPNHRLALEGPESES